MTHSSDALLARMMELHPKLIDLTLGRVERLLEALGNPERKMGRTVHVAGTNGKGSTIALMEAIASAHGLSVNRYTSPHLVRFHERISLDGAPIAEDKLSQILDRCLEANGPDPITYFEITTAAAFVAFAEYPADLTLIEVGLGGRFDATNVIAPPSASVITPVAMDHQHFLGNTLAKIAGEKAGILKRGAPAVIGPQEDEALEVIEAGLKGPALFYGQDYLALPDQGRMSVQHPNGLYDLPLPALAGAHQLENAATAIMALQSAGIELDERKIAEGLQNSTWPARLQDISNHPLCPKGSSLTLDGGHNPHAAQAISDWLSTQNDPLPLWLICGMMATKDNRAYLEILKPHVSGLITLSVESGATGAGLTAEELAAEATGFGAMPANSLEDAFSMLPKEPLRILICGSLYLAGSVLEFYPSL